MHSLDTPLVLQPERPLGSRTAFVFAGGGSLGAIQVGMLKALAEFGVFPDIVVGTSVGSINAAYLAGRPTLQGVLELERIWLDLRRDKLFPINLRSLVRFMRLRDFFLDSRALYLPYGRLEQAKIPIHIVTTDLLSGRTIVLSEGPAAAAIVASCSIPAAFCPVEIDGRFLADGGIASNTPVKTAADLGATRLVVIPTGYACGMTRPPQQVVASAIHGLNLMMCAQVVRDLEALPSITSYHVVPSLCPLDVSSIDFSQTARLIERAQLVARDWLVAGGLETYSVPNVMRPHSHGL